MKSYCIWIGCVTAAILTGCDAGFVEPSRPESDTDTVRSGTQAVRDTQLLGTWYPANPAGGYKVVISNQMLLIYDEETTDYVEIQVTSNDSTSSGERQIEGIKIWGRYQYRRMDGNIWLRFSYVVNDDHLQLVRRWPQDIDESVCPERIDVVRGEPVGQNQPLTGMMSDGEFENVADRRAIAIGRLP